MIALIALLMCVARAEPIVVAFVDAARQAPLADCNLRVAGQPQIETTDARGRALLEQPTKKALIAYCADEKPVRFKLRGARYAVVAIGRGGGVRALHPRGEQLVLRDQAELHRDQAATLATDASQTLVRATALLSGKPTRDAALTDALAVATQTYTERLAQASEQAQLGENLARQLGITLLAERLSRANAVLSGAHQQGPALIAACTALVDDAALDACAAALRARRPDIPLVHHALAEH